MLKFYLQQEILSKAPNWEYNCQTGYYEYARGGENDYSIKFLGDFSIKVVCCDDLYILIAPDGKFLQMPSILDCEAVGEILLTLENIKKYNSMLRKEYRKKINFYKTNNRLKNTRKLSRLYREVKVYSDENFEKQDFNENLYVLYDRNSSISFEVERSEYQLCLKIPQEKFRENTLISDEIFFCEEQDLQYFINAMKDLRKFRRQNFFFQKIIALSAEYEEGSCKFNNN
jgi:hypothetical protein